MSTRTLLVALAVLAFAVYGWQRSRDPRHTPLPFGSTDLSSVQVQLAKLPEEERALVEAYVRRSNGDYLPAGMGDPDNPLTARTFAEAIELERAWSVKMEEQQAKADQLQAARDSRMAPLRALVHAEVTGANIVDAASLREPPSGKQASGGRSEGSFVVDIRLHNRGSESVRAFSGALKARERGAWLPLDLCWIEHREELAAGATLDIRCGGRGIADDQQRAFVADRSGRFKVEWLPQRIELASGRVLEAGD